MNLLEKIINCSTNEEVAQTVSKAIEEANVNGINVIQLGFLEEGQVNCLFKGFIPLKTRIKYENISIETYSLETTDYFYEFAYFIRKYKIDCKSKLIYYLEYFINTYFGYNNDVDRSAIFNSLAWQCTTTDEEYFRALQNNKLGDLKGKNAAQCTERSALAQQILSLFGFESYYCVGCILSDGKQESHCFNVVKRKNDYALLDYSMPVALYNQDGSVKTFYPFVGEITNEEFNNFINQGCIKSFCDYKYVSGNQKVFINNQRKYVIGSFDIEKEYNNKGRI